MGKTIIKSSQPSYKTIYIVNYTTGAANTWALGVASVTIPSDGLYWIRARYNNSPVYGVAYGLTTATVITHCIILKENPTATGIDDIFWIPAGTYSFWFKCSTASVQNALVVNQLIF